MWLLVATATTPQGPASQGQDGRLVSQGSTHWPCSSQPEGLSGPLSHFTPCSTWGRHGGRVQASVWPGLASSSLAPSAPPRGPPWLSSPALMSFLINFFLFWDVKSSHYFSKFLNKLLWSQDNSRKPSHKFLKRIDYMEMCSEHCCVSTKEMLTFCLTVKFS